MGKDNQKQFKGTGQSATPEEKNELLFKSGPTPPPETKIVEDIEEEEEENELLLKKKIEKLKRTTPKEPPRDEGTILVDMGIKSREENTLLPKKPNKSATSPVERQILEELEEISIDPFLENHKNYDKAAAALNDVIKKMSKKEKLAWGVVGFSAAAATVTVTLVPAVQTLVTGCLVAAGVSAGAIAAVFAAPVTIAFIAALAIAFAARALYIRSQQNKTPTPTNPGPQPSL